MRRGPLEDRGCKDIFWCLLYLGMIAGLIAMSVFAFNRGKPEQLLAPYDFTGAQCGFDAASDYSYSYVYFPNNSTTGNKNYCVKKCPSKDDLQQPLECYG